MTSENKPYYFQWTNKSIQNFWYNLRETEIGRNEFAKTAGPRFFDVITSQIQPSDQVFDYGCGSGFLITKLIATGIHAGGLDTTSKALQDNIELIADNPLFGGIYEPAPHQVFDVIIASEIYEHILEEDLIEVSEKWVQHLKPGGRLIITTPNAENLLPSECMCPSCGAMFHRMQHIRTVRAADLSQQFEENLGLERVHVGAYDFSSTRKNASLSLRYTRLQHTFNRQFQQRFNLILNEEKQAKEPKSTKILTKLLSDEAAKLIKQMVEEAPLADKGFDHVEGSRNCLIYIAQKPLN